MDGFDSTTWQALGLVLTLLGLAVSGLVWVRRGAAKGLRAAAWSLLPLAAGLTGVLRLIWEITEAVVEWAGRLAFSPVVWVGLMIAAMAAALFVISGWMLRRSAPPAAARAGVAEPRTASLPRKRSSAATPARTSPTSASPGGGDDMADVEEILRKHGIQ